MAEFEFGPIDVYAVGFNAAAPDAATAAAITSLVEGGDIRLLDVLFVTKDADGGIETVEFEDFGEDLGFEVAELEGSGVIGDEDVAVLSDAIPAGTSGALLAVELLWAKKLASAFAASGGTVLAFDRIPADVVNAVLSDAVLSDAVLDTASAD